MTILRDLPESRRAAMLAVTPPGAAGQGSSALRLLRFFRGEWAEEVRGWVAEGLITAEQGERILARYGLSLDGSGRTPFAYRVLTALAIVFAGAAVLLLLSHNWDELSRAGRMAGLIAATGLVNALGFRQWVRGYRDQAVLWLFAGGILYGASIMLIAQIYHLGEHFPDGLLLWALGILPLAWLTASRLLHALQLLLAALWMMTQWRYGLPWLLPLFAVAALYQVLYRSHSGVLRDAALVLLLVWANGLYAWSMGHYFSPPSGIWAAHLVLTAWLVLLVRGLTLTQLDHPLRGRRAHAQWATHWLMRLALLGLLVFSYVGAWDEFIKAWLRHGLPLQWWLPLVWLLVAALAWRTRMPERSAIIASAAGLTLVLLLVTFWPFEGLALWLAVGINLLLLGLGIAMIRQGMQRGVSSRFYGGVVLLLLLVMLRYLSLIGDYLSSALMFAVAGVILFLAARYWQRHDRRNDRLQESADVE